jgi:hypothetical protein
VVPASESDDDQASAGLQQASWRMPTFSDNESTNAEPTPQAHEGARREAKVWEKAKAKVKEDDKGKGKADGKDKNNAPHQQPSDRKWVAPKLKR